MYRLVVSLQHPLPARLVRNISVEHLGMYRYWTIELQIALLKFES